MPTKVEEKQESLSSWTMDLFSNAFPYFAGVVVGVAFFEVIKRRQQLITDQQDRIKKQQFEQLVNRAKAYGMLGV